MCVGGVKCLHVAVGPGATFTWVCCFCPCLPHPPTHALPIHCRTKTSSQRTHPTKHSATPYRTSPAQGGYTTGRSEVVGLLRQKARPYLFSNTLAPSVAAASLKVFDLLSSSHALRDRLQENTDYFRQHMAAAGFDIRPGNHPIVVREGEGHGCGGVGVGVVKRLETENWHTGLSCCFMLHNPGSTLHEHAYQHSPTPFNPPIHRLPHKHPHTPHHNNTAHYAR